MARAYTAFANDGQLVALSLTKVDSAPPLVQVLSPQTARAMRKMLEMGVSDEGTAPVARIAGYRVAGKTGTAYKLKNGQYVKDYVAVLRRLRTGLGPARRHRGHGRRAERRCYYGGQVAAPVFAQIAGATLRTLQVAPDGPLETPKALLALRQTP